MVYVEENAAYHFINEIKENKKILQISGTELKKKLQEGDEIPEWFSFNEVIKELKKSYPSSNKQGFTIFLLDCQVLENLLLLMRLNIALWKKKIEKSLY